MFTVHVGPVGSGKTFSMVRAAMAAYERGEPVFANLDLDTTGWKATTGSRFVRWREPIDLLKPEVRCGLVLMDELGALMNNREYELWPVALTVKLIEHRKDHLEFHASVQNDELADKNLRRFFNRVRFVREMRLPFGALLNRMSRRPDLMCPNPDCTKQDHLLTEGDSTKFPWVGTWYRSVDVHPEDTQNKYKRRSLGTEWYPFDPRVALAYSSSAKVASEAASYYERLKRMQAGRYWQTRRRARAGVEEGAGPQPPAKP